MNLLMLLSALLSALSGVGSAVRRPELTQAVTQAAATSAVARGAVMAQASRPLAALPTLDAVAACGIGAAFALASPIALWTSRRRE